MTEHESRDVSDIPALIFAEIAPWQLALATIVVAFATIVQFRVGVGFGLTSAALLALINPVLVPVPVILLTMITALWAIARTWRGIVVGEVAVTITGRLLGGLAAVAIIRQLTDPDQFLLVFGLIVGFAVILSVAGLSVPFTRPVLFVLGAISGLTAAITGVGGPPMAIAYQHQPPSHARPNMSAYFGIGCIVLMVILWSNGLVAWHDLTHTALLLPGFVAGMALAPRFEGVIDRNFRTILLAMAGAASLMLIGKALL